MRQVAAHPVREPRELSIALVTRSTDRTNAINEYAAHLTGALRRDGQRADLHVGSSRGFVLAGAEREAGAKLAKQVRGYDAMVLQYNPFLHGRWGFAPWLPLALIGVRRAAFRPLIALMVHEPCVDMADWRSVLMGLWQRAQLGLLVRGSDVVYVSVEAWTPYIRGRRRSTPVYHMPVGSNLPDERRSRSRERARLGIAADGLVLAALGTGHPARLSGYTVAAANRLSRSGRQVTLLNLGAGAPGLAGLDEGVRVHQPGNLAGPELAARLAAADIFLAPYVDGVSSRRTALMAALQHALPIVATDGPSTDPLLRRAGGALRLVPVGRSEPFAEAAFELALAPELRSAMGEAARRLYEECFDWPVLASSLCRSLAGAAEGGPLKADEKRVGVVG